LIEGEGKGKQKGDPAGEGEDDDLLFLTPNRRETEQLQRSVDLF